MDTTVKLKYNLKSHPELTTAEAIARVLAPFGQTDDDSIVLSLKSSKKAPNKPPKFGTALVPFKQIGNAFAAVCASGRPERGLDGIEIGWVGGKEPPILIWLKKMGKLTTPTPSVSGVQIPTSMNSERAEVPQAQPTKDSSSFSTFPASFVRILFPDISLSY